MTLAWSLTDPDLAVVCPRVGPLPPGTSTTCFARGTATAGPHVNTATATGTAPSGATVTDDDPAHHFGVEGAILVEKLVEGEDADEPPGPVLPVGSTVTWTYVVANAGNSALTEVEVVDSKEVEVTCPGTALAVGGSMTCTATGTVVEGPHTNVAVARGTTPLGLVVQDEDPANHLGGAPGILVEKATSGMGDLDAPPGPTLAVGERVEWTFVVTNTGNLPLTDVSVVDDRLGAVACPATGLAVGEAMTCTATGTVEEGPHVNTATATGTDETGATLTDEDVSHHLGVVRAIEVTKRVNGLDADEPPGVYVAAGDRVVMSFEVTNPGTVPLLDVELVDDAGLVPTFVGGDDDGDGELDPGEVWTYEADLGPAAPGRLDNVVTVTAHDGAENGVTDSDPAFAGVVPPAPGPRPDPPGAVEGAGGVPGGAVAGGRLPRTGGDVGRLALVGLGLLVLGAALRRGSRSPRPT